MKRLTNLANLRWRDCLLNRLLLILNLLDLYCFNYEEFAITMITIFCLAIQHHHHLLLAADQVQLPGSGVVCGRGVGWQ